MCYKIFQKWFVSIAFIILPFLPVIISAANYPNTTVAHTSTTNSQKWIFTKPTQPTTTTTTTPPCICTCPTATVPTIRTTTPRPTTRTTTPRRSTMTTPKPVGCNCGKGAHPQPKTLDAISEKRPLTANVTDDARIVQGVLSSPNAWPWMAVLFPAQGSGTLCGATLINNWYVLTAAHCVQTILAGGTSANYNIQLGSNTVQGTDPNRKIYKIGTIKMHPRYDTTVAAGVPRNYDVALIRLKTQVTFSKIIHPICIMPQSGAPYTGSNVVVTGWGLTSPSGGTNSNELREVAMKVIDQAACAKIYGNIIKEDTICAIGNPATKGPCQGDSGGPMMTYVPATKSFTQIGIASFVNECEKNGNPAVFVRVSNVLKFIQQVTKITTC